MSQSLPAVGRRLYQLAPEAVRGTASGDRYEGQTDGTLSLSWTIARLGDAWERRPDGTVQTGSPFSYSVAGTNLTLEELLAIAESVPQEQRPA